MKFVELKLNNFRQYIGEHTIKFSGVNEKENVTVIYGANGYGKTGIFRAIMFCLYGLLYLEQDFLNKEQIKKGLVYVNEKLLESTPDERISAQVEITIQHQDKKYLIGREISGILKSSNNEINQEIRKVYMQEFDKSGNSKPYTYDELEIKEKIDMFLHRKIKDYFLFDGERMEKLTKGGDEQKKEVQNGIKALLQLDTLDKAISGLKRQDKKLTESLGKNESGELAQISEYLNKIKDQISKIEEAIQINDEELKSLSHRENEAEQELDKVKEIRDKQLRRQDLKSKLDSFQREKEKIKRQIRELLTTSGAYISFPVTSELLSNLETKIDKGELPLGIRENFIDHLLEISKCICGEHLKENIIEGKQRRERILQYKKQNVPEGIEIAQKLAMKLAKLVTTINTYSNEYENIISSEQKLKDESKSVYKELEELNKELQGIAETQDIASMLDKIRKERRELESKIPELNFEITRKKREEKELQEKQQRLSQKSKTAKKISDQRDYIQSALTSLILIQNKYAYVMREELSKSATKFFKQIADEETLFSLDRIEINNNFELDVINKSGRGMLFQISSGQRQIVSLSYICAILDVGNNLEIPLLMDTPLGRLSGRHRERCLEKLPQITSQLIILATDTEFQESEAIALRNSGFWGSAYKIIPESDRHSCLKKVEVISWTPTRRNIERI